MNVFHLSHDVVESAQMHPNKLVVKMPLEAAQLVCTALHSVGIATPYKPTHFNHPCAVYARSSDAGFLATVDYGLALCMEYTFRYGKTHACQAILDWAHNQHVSGMFGDSDMPVPQAMPDEFKHSDPVVAYRAYVNATKKYRFEFKTRNVPSWVR